MLFTNAYEAPLLLERTGWTERQLLDRVGPSPVARTVSSSAAPTGPGSRCAGRLLLFLFDRLRTHLHYREAGRYMRSEIFGYSKRGIAAPGADLHRRGVLADPADVFLLGLDELFGFVDGSGATHDLAGLVGVRRGDAERTRRLTPVREFATGDVVATSVSHAEEPAMARRGQEVLNGLGSCPGRVRGRARVVLSPALGEDLAPETILIVRKTDPRLAVSDAGGARDRGRAGLPAVAHGDHRPQVRHPDDRRCARGDGPDHGRQPDRDRRGQWPGVGAGGVRVVTAV
ncbi:hypothetical protein, partial [Streptomyces antimycoticus]